MSESDKQTKTDWQPNETLGFRFDVGFNNSKVVGQDIFLADGLDYNSFPAAQPFPTDSDVVWVVTTSRCWNALNKKLIELIPDEMPTKPPINMWQNKRLKLTWHRSFQIPETDIIRVFSEVGVIFWIKVDVKQKGYDLLNSIRFGTDVEIDTQNYPLVVVTKAAWNNVQHLVDELKLRDELRKTLAEVRAPSFLIKTPQLMKFTHSMFEIQRQKLNNTRVS